MSTEEFQHKILPLQDKMYRYALSILMDSALAEDTVQDVLLKLWDKRNDLARINNMEAWCIRLTRNRALDQLKKANRKKMDMGLEHLPEPASDHDSPNEVAEHSDLVQTIYRLMKDLTPQQQEIFRLRDLLGYSNKEIKDILSLNDNQVKVNLFRARQKIKLKLGKLINYGLG